VCVETYVECADGFREGSQTGSSTERPSGGLSTSGRPVAYLSACSSTLGQGVSGGLGLQHPDRLALDEQHVVGDSVAVGHLELAHGDARSGGQVEFGSVLDDPACGVQGLVNLCTGLLFW